MIAVIFEAEPHAGQQQAYLDAAAMLRPQLDHLPGFISIERFGSLTTLRTTGCALRTCCAIMA